MYNPFEDKIDKKKLSQKINELEEEIAKLKKDNYNYSVYLTSACVESFIQKAIDRKNKNFQPAKFKEIQKYFSELDPDFDIQNLKYTDSIQIDKISRIISNYGLSGFSYLQNVPKVLDINKPTLLFYGLEQLSSYYMNLFFNFTIYNEHLDNFRDELRRHGIGPHNFYHIPPDINIQELLKNKIKLKKRGLAPIVFLINCSTQMTSLIDYFLENKEITFIELLANFFTERDIIPEVITKKFVDFYDIFLPKDRLFSLSLTIYLLAFLFSHLSRYKMDTWLKILNTEEKALSYFIKYFLNNAAKLFLEQLFIRIIDFDSY